MIRVTVELISARTGKTTMLGLMDISNDGTGTPTQGHYNGRVMRKRTFAKITREGRVENHNRINKPIWTLIAKMLINMGYDK